MIVDDGQPADTKVASQPDTVTITAEIDDPPVAYAGPNQTVCTFEEVQLDGSGSYDPEGAPITYNWYNISAPPGSNVDTTWLSDPSNDKPTFVPDVAGDYTVYLQVSDGEQYGYSSVTITAANPQVSMNCVNASFFTQGPSQTEIDASIPLANELPPFGNELSWFDVSPLEVTNCLYTLVLNYANSEGYLDPVPKVFGGGNVFYNGQLLLQIEDIGVDTEHCDIEYDTTHNIFFVARRDGQSMAKHPVVEVSWYGALAFCNWRSEIDLLGPVYDLTTWDFNGVNFDGYRLPYEREWEYAAAWEDLGDGGQHHIWGFVSSLALTDINTQRVNYNDSNPLSLATIPYTSPVGYYDGNNGTTNSQSPASCYDMSGNVWEWIWEVPYDYPTPSKGVVPDQRLIRGGSWDDVANDVRTARRDSLSSDSTTPTVGFRIFRDYSCAIN